MSAAHMLLRTFGVSVDKLRRFGVVGLIALIVQVKNVVCFV